LTLDRDGHLYFGVAGGVGLSATVVSASAVAGQITTSGAPKPDELDKFLDGDSVSVSASVVGEVGAANSAGGTAVQMGVGVVQVSGQFQHNWHVVDLPIRW
jgi:hypothetical protein